jgi:hypothetical protein
VTWFQWFQAAGIGVTLISFLISFPITIQSWNEERTLVDRIEHNSKVIPQTTEEGVQRVLWEDNDFHALKLAALRLFPTPKWTRRIGTLATLLYLAALIELIALPIVGLGWRSVTYALATYLVGLLLAFTVVSRIWRYHANRNAFALLGAPADFREAARSRVPYRNTVIHVYYVYFQRSMKVIRRAISDSSGSPPEGRMAAAREMRPPLTEMWDRIIDAQERYYRKKHWRGRKIRQRARRIRKIRNRLERDLRRQRRKQAVAQLLAQRQDQRGD